MNKYFKIYLYIGICFLILAILSTCDLVRLDNSFIVGYSVSSLFLSAASIMDMKTTRTKRYRYFCEGSGYFFMFIYPFINLGIFNDKVLNNNSFVLLGFSILFLSSQIKIDELMEKIENNNNKEYQNE